MLSLSRTSINDTSFSFVGIFSNVIVFCVLHCKQKLKLNIIFKLYKTHLTITIKTIRINVDFM